MRIKEEKKITNIINCKRYYDQLVEVGGETTPPSDVMPEAKKWTVQMNCQKPANNRNKIHSAVSRSASGTGHCFCKRGHFLQWLQGEEETFADICI